jgi:hypothetical protein
MKLQRPFLVTPAFRSPEGVSLAFMAGAGTGLCSLVASNVGRTFLSRSPRMAAECASRTCVAAATQPLLISRHRVQSPGSAAIRVSGRFRAGLGVVGVSVRCRVNGILIMFPLACSISRRGRFGRMYDRSPVRLMTKPGDSQGWDLSEARRRQGKCHVRQAELTGAKE